MSALKHLFLIHFFGGVLVFVVHVQYIYMGNFIGMLYALCLIDVIVDYTILRKEKNDAYMRH